MASVQEYEVFLKYLPSSADEATVREHFQNCGEILGDVRLLRDSSGNCKGVGWITFSSRKAQAAALRLDGSRIGDRNVQVSEAKTSNWAGGHASTVGGVTGTIQAVGTHTPAMIKEVVATVVARETNAAFVDGTFGRGGHSRGILAALGPKGQLHAFDLDPNAIAEGKKLEKEDSRFHIHHCGFGSMREVLKPLGVRPAGVFMDLGISSPQLDDEGRGFRPEQPGPLDLRFDLTSGQSGADFLRTASRAELLRVFRIYGDASDPYCARRVADAVCLARSSSGSGCPKTTQAFGKLVSACRGYEYQAMHPAKTVFQALRIHLNDEFGQLRDGMAAARKILRPGGRIGILTWKHSECAAVVEFLRKAEIAPPEFPLLKWYKDLKSDGNESVEDVVENWGLEARTAQRPSAEELRLNSRSRSAVLHVLNKRCGFRCADLEKAASSHFGWEEAQAEADADADDAEDTANRKRARTSEEGGTSEKKAKRKKVAAEE
eukprot:TRINITY_DN3331_c1_g4_i1.p1 TRINITY_DN3331_c1_g4~~TRINITY_DN3331_c1_g4_i1.p1  ORF type:complete len:491 (-),score=88.64 TRINITY_DN3331_c1_g4_i1:356-1828(-)